jgi:hypothetical protein
MQMRKYVNLKRKEIWTRIALVLGLVALVSLSVTVVLGTKTDNTPLTVCMGLLTAGFGVLVALIVVGSEAYFKQVEQYKEEVSKVVEDEKEVKKEEVPNVVIRI